jgi:hypothetical protein
MNREREYARLMLELTSVLSGEKAAVGMNQKMHAPVRFL